MLRSPFFLVGCGRSGNTLLRAMLNQHPQIAIPPESLFIPDYFQAGSTTSLKKMKRLLLQEYEIKKEWAVNIELEDFHNCQTVTDLINKIHELYLKKHQKVIWGQKTPRFIRYTEILNQIYPHAKFIHIIRDPRAVVNSLIKSDAHRSSAYHGAIRWLNDVKHGLELKRTSSNAVLEVKYENLIRHTREVLQEICAFLEIDFYEDVLKYYKSRHGEFTNEYFYEMVKNIYSPPDISKIDRWKKELTSKQIQLIETICAEIMPQLGYQVENPNSTIPSSYIIFSKLQRIVGLTQQFWHYARTRPGYILCTLRRKFFLGLLFQGFSKIDS